ncbi:hypothetical protein A3F05_03630 [Candidatus Saccharibacteria bacterium RIFCSPHIGHO2_12_FULL_47_17]|nr:MAG: hypothetical protein A3F05_03630 [Candidatus Saccharibacteria bacterium RIFCSPHIGHO2_12_FULL_47_17]
MFFIWFGKTLSWLLRLSRHHGAALPGLIIERLHPKFLNSMLTKLPEGVIIVSGTNGKTTTTKMITELLRSQGKRVLTNRTGGNFVRGVFSTIVQAATLSGRLPYDVAVYEQDEAYAVRFVKLHEPRAAVLLNVTRDQLDRFGEIDTTAALLQRVANHTSQAVVVNDDDIRLNKIVVTGSVKAVYFGVSKNLQAQFPNDEQLYGALSQDLTKHKRTVELEATGEKLAKYKLDAKTLEAKLQIDGQHNALNGAAALATVHQLYPDVPLDDFVKTLSNIKPAFGRGERIDFGGKTLILQLIKNPASFRQALHVLDIHKPKAVGIVINDNHADGRDVSWLWDIDFKPLAGLPVVTSGIRGFDMANRLKYDDVSVEGVESDLKKMVDEVGRRAEPGQTAIIFATYTAMLATRKAIGRLTKVEKV